MSGGIALSLRIGLAHLSARPRQSLIAVVGVAVGVGFFLAVSAMMIGSQTDLVRTLVDSAPHIIVRDETREAPAQPAEAQFSGAAVEIHGLGARDEVRGLRDWPAMLAAARALDGVIAAPALIGGVTVRFAGRSEALALSGIDPRIEDRIVNLNEDLVGGAIADLESAQDGIIVSTQVAERLGARLGDIVIVSSSVGVVQRARIIALLNSNSRAGSERAAYALLRNAQVLFARPNIVNQLRIKLADPDSAPAVSAAMEARWGYQWESWQERSRDLMASLAIHNIITYAVTSALLLVASFGVYTLISTNVTEKRRDIAILRATGFSEADITGMFLIEGVTLGVVGSVLGFALGYGLMQALAAAPVSIQGQDHHIPLDQVVLQYAIAGGASVFAATIAAYLPARRAARLDPVAILRGAA